MKPQTFHLCVAVLLAAAAVYAAVNEIFMVAGFTACGALVALFHYKAAKSGLTD